MTSLSAVLTGDLIRSRQSDPRLVDAAIDVLASAAADFGRAWTFDPRFTRFRGDGWQVVLPDPAYVLDACIYLSARLTAEHPLLQTRVSAGGGEAIVPQDGDLSAASGSAFFISGDHLDNMSKRRRLIVAGHGIGTWQNAVVLLADWMIGTWSGPQSEAVALTLLGDETNEQMARRLGITRQAFEARLNGSGFQSLGEALHAFRTHDYGGAAP